MLEIYDASCLPQADIYAAAAIGAIEIIKIPEDALDEDAIDDFYEEILMGKLAIAKIGDQVAGFATYSLSPKNDYASLDLLATESCLKGRGVGTELVKYVISDASDNNASYLNIISTAGAVGFYENLGLGVDNRADNLFRVALV